MDDVTISVGGHRVAAHFRAGPDPAVVVVPALGQTFDYTDRSWDQALNGVDAAVWSFDRPAVGRTPARGRRDPMLYSEFAAELADQLAAASIHRPVVLVGHSFGALISLMLAEQWPDVVAGVVFVDPSLPALDLGTPRGTVFIDGDDDTGNQIDVAEADVAAKVALPDRPAVVLSRSPGWWYPPGTPAPPDEDRRWHRWHADLARRWQAPRAVAEDAGHQLQRDAPQMVAAAITAVVDAVRADQPVVDADVLGVPGVRVEP